MSIIFRTHSLLFAIGTKVARQRAYASSGWVVWQVDGWTGHSELPGERELLSLRRKMLRKFPALPMNMVTRLRFDKRNTAVGQRAWSKVRFPPITDSLAPKSALSPV